MIDNKTPIWIGVFLIATMVIAGCTSPSATPPVQTPAPTTAVQTVVPTTIEATTVKVTTAVVTAKPTDTLVEKEILHDSGILTTKTFKK